MTNLLLDLAAMIGLVVAALAAFTALGYLHSALFIWLRDKGYDVEY